VVANAPLAFGRAFAAEAPFVMQQPAWGTRRHLAMYNGMRYTPHMSFAARAP